MAGNALLLVLLRRLVERTDVNPFLHLRASPDLYVHEDLRYGWAQEDEKWLPVPESVRSVWAAPDRWHELGSIPRDPELQLPGETWLDVKERRERVDRLRKTIRDGGVASVEALIVENIDLRALLLDTIRLLTVPSDVLAAWEETTDTLVLDPTCGSGAFLFAALDVLDDVYAAIVETAQSHVDSGSPDAARVLAEITSQRKEDQNLAYFRLKHASLNNLYGLDIMSEAVEIAKLRLFLALAARLDRPEEIEPLPDLDFNIKAGNLLVGFRDLDDARTRVAVSLGAYKEIEALLPKAKKLVRERTKFVSLMESSGDDNAIHTLKASILSTTGALRAAVDAAYHRATNEIAALEEWRELARPFHWFVEFPHIVERDGFDVVVGNPPYVQRRDVEYAFAGFATDGCPDIFAPCMERAAALARPEGTYSMIVPIAFQFSNDYEAARREMSLRVPWRCVSTYSRNPSALFTAGLGVRSAIVVGSRTNTTDCKVTETRRWTEEFRPHLFHATRYATSPDDGARPWPRVGNDDLSNFYKKLRDLPGTLGLSTRRHGSKLGFKQTSLYYLSVFVDEPPAWHPNGERAPQTQVGLLHFDSDRERDVAYVLLAGRTGVWWWGATGDDFHVTAGLLKSFPISLEAVRSIWDELGELARELRHEQPQHPIVTLYAKKEMGNYDMLRCRHITDRADRLVLDHLGLGKYWPELLAADARLLRVTGERPGTEREWPFPWTPPFETIANA